MSDLIKFCVSISIDADIDVLLDAGFEKVSSDQSYIMLKLPRGWHLKVTDEKGVRLFVDENGNIRGAFLYNYAYLRRRYEIDTLKATEADYPETEKLVVKDRKTDEIIMDFGTFEPYSDYEKDLNYMARNLLQRRYEDWENPLAYWDK